MLSVEFKFGLASACKPFDPPTHGSKAYPMPHTPTRVEQSLSYFKSTYQKFVAASVGEIQCWPYKNKNASFMVLVITLTGTDLDILNRDITIATSQNTTYLSITAYSIQDTSNNRVAPIPSTDALQAADFIDDVTIHGLSHAHTHAYTTC